MPYESTRVCLQPIRGVEGSDYINASFIDGYRYQALGSGPGQDLSLAFRGPQSSGRWAPAAPGAGAGWMESLDIRLTDGCCL
jgi:hypothetical protein